MYTVLFLAAAALVGLSRPLMAHHGTNISYDFIKTPEGWAGLLEDICAPVDELEFNRVIRDPAGTGKPPVPPPVKR